MKSSPYLFVALFFTCILSACDVETPTLASCQAYQYEAGSVTRKWALKPAKVEVVSRWFSRHRTGWSKSYVSFAPKLLLSCKSEDGLEVSINVMANTIIFNSHEQKFADAEIVELRAAIEASD